MVNNIDLGAMPNIIYAHQGENNLGLAGGWRKEKLFMQESVKYIRYDVLLLILEVIIWKIEAEKMEHNTKLKTIEGTGRISITNAALDKAISIIREEWEL